MARVQLFLKIVAVLALGAGTVVAGGSASSQPARCGLRQPLVEWLERGFQEERAAYGLSERGELVEVFVAPSGTWTILVSYPGGPTCILAAGDSWLDIENLPDPSKKGPVS